MIYHWAGGNTRPIFLYYSKGDKEFNRLGTALACPITQGGDFARHAGFAVSLSGAGTHAQGVVLCNQLRTLDLAARKATFVEKLPSALVDVVLAILQTLIE